MKSGKDTQVACHAQWEKEETERSEWEGVTLQSYQSPITNTDQCLEWDLARVFSGLRYFKKKFINNLHDQTILIF